MSAHILAFRISLHWNEPEFIKEVIDSKAKVGKMQDEQMNLEYLIVPESKGIINEWQTHIKGHWAPYRENLGQLDIKITNDRKDYKIRIHELLLIQINMKKGKGFSFQQKPNKYSKKKGNRKSRLAAATKVVDPAGIIRWRRMTRNWILT